MPTTIDALESAYQAGWMAAAGWANRPDLLADMGSGAFTKEQAAAVQRIALAHGEPPLELEICSYRFWQTKFGYQYWEYTEENRPDRECEPVYAVKNAQKSPTGNLVP